jgi:hypothetical protein
MKKTILTCDRCKKEVNAADFFPVEAKLKTHSAEDRNKKDWCRSCCIKFNLLPELVDMPDAKRQDPPPTLEDFIREIIREEIR